MFLPQKGKSSVAPKATRSDENAVGGGGADGKGRSNALRIFEPSTSQSSKSLKVPCECSECP
jgi:hypothetical protein